MLVIAFVAPCTLFADSWVDGIISAAQNGNGTVVESHSSASVSTGGQTAAAGESVSSDDVSASSHIETHINASDSGGTIKVKVQTSENGDVHTEEYSKDLAPGESVQVNIGISSSTKAKAETKTRAGAGAPAHPAPEATPRGIFEVSPHVSSIFSAFHLPDFIKHFFSFFWRF